MESGKNKMTNWYHVTICFFLIWLSSFKNTFSCKKHRTLLTSHSHGRPWWWRWRRHAWRWNKTCCSKAWNWADMLGHFWRSFNLDWFMLLHPLTVCFQNGRPHNNDWTSYLLDYLLPVQPLQLSTSVSPRMRRTQLPLLERHQHAESKMMAPFRWLSFLSLVSV